jgi:type II secretion system protein H
MTSRTGSRKNRAARACSTAAFTLIELVLVLALLLIVLSVAFPSLQGFFRGRNLDSEAKRFLALTRYGQSRAVSEGLPMELWIDPKQGTYGLRAQTGYAEPDTDARWYRLDQGLKLQIVPSPTGPLLQSNLWTQGARAIGSTPPIRFLPDGFIAETSPAQIVLCQDVEDEIRIIESSNHLQYEIQSGNSPNVVR